MKTAKLAMIVIIIAAALFILFPSLSWAGEEGAGIYKAKCAACHGTDASGKPAAKIPSLISAEVKKMSDDEISKAIAEKPKHAAVSKSLTSDQLKAVVSHIRSLQ